MGKCCSIDRNELPDENIQIIKMKIPKPTKNEVKFKQNQEELEYNSNEKPFNSNSHMNISSSQKPEPSKFLHKESIEVKFEAKYEEKIEDQENRDYDEENLNEIADQDLRMHVFS